MKVNFRFLQFPDREAVEKFYKDYNQAAHNRAVAPSFYPEASADCGRPEIRPALTTVNPESKELFRTFLCQQPGVINKEIEFSCPVIKLTDCVNKLILSFAERHKIVFEKVNRALQPPAP